MGLVSGNNAVSNGSDETGRDFFAHWFKERELLLRTDGEIRYLRVSPKLQAFVCAGVFALGLWTTGASVSGWVQHLDLNKKAEEIVEAKLSYDNLRREVDRFEARMVGLNTRMLELISDDSQTSVSALKDEIRQFGGLGTELRLAVKRLSIDLDLPESEKHRIITSRKSLHDQISLLEGHLNTANQRVENLRVDIADLNNDIIDTNAMKQRISKDRDKLLMSVAKLEGRLDSTQNKNTSLSSDVTNLSEDIAENRALIAEFETQDAQLRDQLSKYATELDDLNTVHSDTKRRIALVTKRLSNTEKTEDDVSVPYYNGELAELNRLEFQTKRIISDLSTARQSEENMDKAIDVALGGLGRVAGFDRSQTNTNRNKPDQVLSLLAQIESLHASQLDIVKRLNIQAASNITQVENLIKTTGVDPNRILEISGLPVGMGGPLIETDFVDGSAAKLEIKVAALESKVTKWETLQKITRCIPMMAPVDYYNLTSGFGKRKDPFTGKKAIHNGIDMGGWPGTSVWATAPGKITFAGNSGRYGKMVEIDHGCGIKTIYGHLKKVLVKKGQQVEHRHNIGILGSTGRSTGPHVHFEIRVEGQPVDPMKFIEAGRYVFKG